MMVMVKGSCVGVEVRRDETCEGGKKRPRVSNGDKIIRQEEEEEEAYESGNKRHKTLNELIDHCSFKIFPLHKVDGNIDFEKCANLEKSTDHVSPEKAMRAAMLKSRVADTISKAAKALNIVRYQCNELEIRRRRERNALEDMEKYASDNVDKTTTDVETLFGAKGYPNPEVLKRLGLYIKDEEEEYKERCNELERRRQREREALEEVEKKAAANVDNTTAILKSLGFSTSWFGYYVGD